MKRLGLLLFPCLALAEEGAVDLTPRWQTGESYAVDFRIEEKRKGDGLTFDWSFHERYVEEVTVAAKDAPEQLHRIYSRFETRIDANPGAELPFEHREEHRGLLGRRVRLRPEGDGLAVSSAEKDEVRHALALAGTLAGLGCRWEDLLPGRKVAPGGTWTVEGEKVARLFPGKRWTTARAVCRFEKLEGKLARIHVTVSTTVNGEVRAYEGHVLFSPERGRALSVALKGKIRHEMEFEELKTSLDGEGEIRGSLEFRE